AILDDTALSRGLTPKSRSCAFMLQVAADRHTYWREQIRPLSHCFFCPQGPLVVTTSNGMSQRDRGQHSETHWIERAQAHPRISACSTFTSPKRTASSQDNEK